MELDFTVLLSVLDCKESYYLEERTTPTRIAAIRAEHERFAREYSWNLKAVSRYARPITDMIASWKREEDTGLNKLGAFASERRCSTLPVSNRSEFEPELARRSVRYTLEVEDTDNSYSSVNVIECA